MQQKYILDLDSAKRVAAASELEADKHGWTVVIAIVDDGGHLLYLQRDKAQIGSIDVAIKKARSAALFRRSTLQWVERVESGGYGYMEMPGIMPVEGGLPLTYQGETIGGIGVSGVKANEDALVAEAGVAAL